MTKLFKKQDLLLLAAVFIVAGGFLLLTRAEFGADYVEISHDGVTVATLPLGVDTVYELDGNTVVIADGAARVSNADCPDQVCVAHIPVSKNSESIVCLPNRVVVTARASDNGDVDAVVG